MVCSFPAIYTVQLLQLIVNVQLIDRIDSLHLLQLIVYSQNMRTIKKQRITLFISPSIVKHAKAQAIIEELSLTSLVEKALIKYLPNETVIKKPEINIEKKS